MKHKYNRVKVIAFSMLIILLFSYINQVMRLKQLEEPWDMSIKINGLRNERRNTIDVMYFGSSQMYCSINPVVMWETAGIPSYSYATQQQPFWISYHYMKEALKYQSPKVVVLDIYMAKQQEDYTEEGINRTAIDLLPMSLNRIDMINVAVPKEERISYYINFLKYHSRWADLVKEDFDLSYLRKTDPLKGYVMLDKITPIAYRDNLEGYNTTKSLTTKNMLYLEKIIELSREENFQLVLYKAPSTASKEEKAYFNAVENIAKANRIPYIDYNMLYDEVGLDMAKDFYDKGHVNYIGAEKVTIHFANYLKSSFNLEDKRQDAKYNKWQEAVVYYQEQKENRPLTVVKQ